MLNRAPLSKPTSQRVHDDGYMDTSASDAAEIRAHVESLFEAFLAGDREALRSGRIPTWRGFQIRSTRLIEGVDEYMEELEKAMVGLRVSRYEFLDFEVDIRGDIALVYYIARDWIDGDTQTVLVRALDAYERGRDGWIQIGSNICVLADQPQPD